LDWDRANIGLLDKRGRSSVFLAGVSVFGPR
jgi:hypothetical protein